MEYKNFINNSHTMKKHSQLPIIRKNPFAEIYLSSINKYGY